MEAGAALCRVVSLFVRPTHFADLPRDMANGCLDAL